MRIMCVVLKTKLRCVACFVIIKQIKRIVWQKCGKCNMQAGCICTLTLIVRNEVLIWLFLV